MSRITQSEIEIIATKAFDFAVRHALHSGAPEDAAIAGVVAIVRDELEKAGVRTQQKRSAIVEGGLNNLDRRLNLVANYLPANFEARVFADATLGDVVLIEGYDRAGWTLDTYVIPRLASGLIVAKEVK
jgi:hypothetical protein